MATQISPSYEGIVLGSRDALLLFTAAIQGHIPMISRRPHDKERAQTIASGNVFIYCETGSAIKRWTDGVTWSPSRIMGNFLIYRELNKGFPPGEKKRAAKKKRSEDGDDGYDASEDNLPPLAISKDQERTLIGSLIESYDFKKEGLVKKTISVKTEGQVYHLVSYYTLRDALTSKLHAPSAHHQFSQMRILDELLVHQSFRVQVDGHGNEITTTSHGNSNSPPSSPPLQSPPPLSHHHHDYTRDPPYSTHPPPPLPIFGTSTYSVSAICTREYPARDPHHLQYDGTGAGRTYTHLVPPQPGLASSRPGEHDGLGLYNDVPRTSQLAVFGPHGGSGAGEFSYQDPSARHYSAGGALPSIEGGGGGSAIGLPPHPRQTPALYVPGSHYNGSTDPSSYTISPIPASPSGQRYVSAHPLSPVYSAPERSSIAALVSRNGHSEETQRPGITYQQVAEDSYPEAW